MRFRAPASVALRRAQLTLILAAVVPTGLLTAAGVLLLAIGGDGASVRLLFGVLVLSFCALALTGYVLGSIYIGRGASLARVQNDFLSSVSHELRTPLTSIRMFVEMLREGRVADEDERQRCLDLVQRELARLETLVARLIELTKIEAGRHAFRRERVEVAELAGAARVGLQAAALGAQVELVTDVPEGLAVLGDRDALAQALVNLLVNAYKYGGADDRIELIGRPAGRRVEIAVVDHGPGIPRAEQRVIFDTFERGRAAIDAASEGSGLGLTIVSAIVRAHRGRVRVRSDSRSGTRFSMLLPRAP